MRISEANYRNIGKTWEFVPHNKPIYNPHNWPDPIYVKYHDEGCIQREMVFKDKDAYDTWRVLQ